MKTMLDGVPELLEGVIAELYTIRLSSGSYFYFTTADIDVTHSGNTYLTGKFNLERTAITTSVGISVDDVTISVYQHADDQFMGVTLPKFAINGGFDGAWIKIERARNTYTVHLFEGMVSDARPNGEKVELTVSASTLLLNVQMPRNLHLPGCGRSLFDSGCGLLKSDFSSLKTVAYGSTDRIIVCDAVEPDGYFDIGTVTFTSGVNSGATRTIKQYSAGVITLSSALPSVPSDGDTFLACPGCDKRRTTCKNVFNNEPRWRGFPYIPTPEASI